MAYKVPDLPYAYDALEPHISEETMRTHHDKHHQAYVDKANAALAGTEWEDVRPKEILTRLGELPDDLRDTVRNNAGGQYNHCMFWRSMSPDGGGEPEGKLLHSIKDTFDTFGRFKETMKDAGLSVFGSGWAWLVFDGKRVFIVTTPNQDNPIMDGLTPLLGLDVWEHAYYLTYENRRAEYIDGWFNVIDWATVEQRFAEAPRPDVSEILERPVSIQGTDKAFGTLTLDDARTQASELKALAGWGPMAKVGTIARSWTDLAKILEKRSAETVADLEPSQIEQSAVDLWIIPPPRTMV
ncbi:MAG: superoxide dismutase [Solirubrobacteraceae bacterium]